MSLLVHLDEVFTFLGHSYRPGAAATAAADEAATLAEAAADLAAAGFGSAERSGGSTLSARLARPGAPSELRITGLREHHAVVAVNGDSPELGDVIVVVPNHVCTAVNLVPGTPGHRPGTGHRPLAGHRPRRQPLARRPQSLCQGASSLGYVLMNRSVASVIAGNEATQTQQAQLDVAELSADESFRLVCRPAGGTGG